MLRTKEQNEKLQKEKLVTHLSAVKDDLNKLSAEIDYIFTHKAEVKEVAPEVLNVLVGIQRDLRFGKDRIKGMNGILFK